MWRQLDKEGLDLSSDMPKAPLKLRIQRPLRCLKHECLSLLNDPQYRRSGDADHRSRSRGWRRAPQLNDDKLKIPRDLLKPLAKRRVLKPSRRVQYQRLRDHKQARERRGECAGSRGGGRAMHRRRRTLRGLGLAA